MTLADKEKAYLWFISFVYRLRNALFHEIIDPLNDEWQVIFKNSYHVLKQVVDQNIWRLKQLKLLPSASQAAAEEDYNREPPPDIDWPTDEEAKFTWFYYEMLKRESCLRVRLILLNIITRQSARLGGMNLYLRLQLKMPASQAW